MKKEKYVIVRSKSAGVFAGYLKKQNRTIVTLKNARRIWRWEGAASLSQLAMDGTSKPDKCKFPKPVKKVKLFEVVEILLTTKKAKKSIESVPEWNC